MIPDFILNKIFLYTVSFEIFVRSRLSHRVSDSQCAFQIGISPIHYFLSE
nr:MAG TPA: hypothetical protein [Caudoviricetes sp.]